MKKLLLILTVGLIALAGCSSNDVMKGYPKLKGKNHQFVTESYTDIVTNMENKVPGVYYIGFPDCPWCQVLAPELNTILKDHDLKANLINIRSSEFENNEILQERLAEFMKTFTAGAENSKGSVPFIVAISKDGIVDGHLGITPDYNDNIKPLTEAQREYLTARLDYLFQDIK